MTEPQLRMQCVVMCVDSAVGRGRQELVRRQLAMAAYDPRVPVELVVGPARGDPRVESWLHGDAAAPRPAHAACVYGDEAHAAVHTISVLAVMRRFLESSDELLLLAEDDVAFIAGIGDKLAAAVRGWRTQLPASHVLRLGYLPYDFATDAASVWPPTAGAPRVAAPHDDLALFLQPPLTFKLVGMQATVFDRVAARLFVDGIGPSYAHARAVVDAMPQAPVMYSHGWPVITDHLLHLPALGTAVVVPPLAIEGRTTASIFGSQHAETLWSVAERYLPHFADGYFKAGAS